VLRLRYYRKDSTNSISPKSSS